MSFSQENPALLISQKGKVSSMNVEKELLSGISNPARNNFVTKKGNVIAVGAVIGFTMLGPAAASGQDADSTGKSAQFSAIKSTAIESPALFSSDTCVCLVINLSCIMRN